MNIYETFRHKLAEERMSFYMNYSVTFEGATAVCSTAGGEMVSYKSPQGQEYIWQGDPAHWSGHAPVLFPIVGALKEDTVRIDGQAYRLIKHGFARKSEFEKSAEGPGFLEFTLVDTASTRENYPFAFRLTIRHSITAKGFTTAYTVQNTGTGSLPFCIGGHCGFVCPMHPGEAFSDYELVFDREVPPEVYYTDGKSILHREFCRNLIQNGTTLPLSYTDFANDVLIFPEISSQRLLLRNRDTGKGLEFSFHNLPDLGIWTPPGKESPFLCLEPWHGLPDWEDATGHFEDKPGAVFLTQGQCFTADYSMIIQD